MVSSLSGSSPTPTSVYLYSSPVVVLDRSSAASLRPDSIGRNRTVYEARERAGTDSELGPEKADSNPDRCAWTVQSLALWLMMGMSCVTVWRAGHEKMSSAWSPGGWTASSRAMTRTSVLPRRTTSPPYFPGPLVSNVSASLLPLPPSAAAASPSALAAPAVSETTTSRGPVMCGDVYSTRYDRMECSASCLNSASPASLPRTSTTLDRARSKCGLRDEMMMSLVTVRRLSAVKRSVSLGRGSRTVPMTLTQNSPCWSECSSTKQICGARRKGIKTSWITPGWPRCALDLSRPLRSQKARAGSEGQLVTLPPSDDLATRWLGAGRPSPAGGSRSDT
mmetsp:Transcript_68653/g.183239  ORF Transcript_68653/g.183239 Transcript_68653/m.183239 type:complete len:336 (-) Transcript_68653:1463-2470(-)